VDAGGRAVELVTALARPRSVARAPILVVVLGGALLMFAVLLLAIAPTDRTLVVSALALATIGYVLALLGARRATRDEVAPPRLWGTILIVALAARAVLVLSDPVLEDDVHRYLWDGAVTASGESPYRFSPQDVMDARLGREVGSWSPTDAERLGAVVELSHDPELEPHFLAINYPSVPTIYPPAAQGVFAVVAAVAPGSIVGLKLVVVVADLFVAWGVWILLVRLKRPRWWFVAYAWSPLVLVTFAGAAHMDSLAMAAVVGSLVAVERRAVIAAGMLLGVAIGMKLFAVIAIPILLVRLGPRGIVALMATLALELAPFAGEPRLFEGLATFATQWRYNEAGFGLVSSAIGDGAARTTIALVLVALVGVLAWRAREELLPIRAITIAFAALVIMAPAVNPWYVAWLLPLAILSGARSLVVLTVTVLGYYAIGLVSDDRMIRVLEYVPPLVVLFVDWRDFRCAARFPSRESPVMAS
jgi:alpha-1,2-mannosyltransferase